MSFRGRPFFPRCGLPGRPLFPACLWVPNAALWPARKEFLESTAAMCGKDRKPRNLFMQVREPADDLISHFPGVVAVQQDHGLADALSEPALVVNGIANVKQPPLRRQVYED